MGTNSDLYFDQSTIWSKQNELFDGNGHVFGRDIEDWLQAERELVWKTAIKLEKDNDIRLQIATPDVDPKDLDKVLVAWVRRNTPANTITRPPSRVEQIIG